MAAQHLSREKHKASLIISRLSTAGGWHFSSLRAANHAARKKETVRSCCLLYATAALLSAPNYRANQRRPSTAHRKTSMNHLFTCSSRDRTTIYHRCHRHHHTHTQQVLSIQRAFSSLLMTHSPLFFSFLSLPPVSHVPNRKQTGQKIAHTK